MKLLSVGGLPSPILNVGTGPMPSVAATNNSGLLVFVYDDPCKPTGKHQEIYYARWNGSQWTTHSALTNNMNPDLMPAAAIDVTGNEIAVWVTAPEPTGSETGPRDILPGCEIVFSKYDSGGGVWSAPQKITNNSYADLQPWFEKIPTGGTRVCWIASQTNAIPVWHDEEIAPLLDMMAADWSGTSFGTPYAVATNLQTVSPPSVCRSATDEFMAYVKDTDNNSGTAEDREIVVRTHHIGQAWGPDQQLTSDSISDTAAQVAINEANIPMVAWVKRMAPKTLPDGNQTNVDQLWFAEWADGNWSQPVMAFEADGIAEPKLIVNSAKKIVLFWVAASKEFSDIYYSVFDSAYKQWGPPQQITHDQGAETMISLAESGGNILAGYVKRRIDLSDPNVPPVIGLSDIYLMEHNPARDLYVSPNDISFEQGLNITGLAGFASHWLDIGCGEPNNWCGQTDFDQSGSVDFSDFAIFAREQGYAANIRADIHLSGDFTVEDINVSFYDGEPNSGIFIGSTTIDTILPGEVKQVCVEWGVPDDANSHHIWVVIDPNNIIPETDDFNNNKASLALFKPDLKPGKPCVLGYPGLNTVIVGFSVRNNGDATAQPSTCEVRKGSKTGEIIYSGQIGQVALGESVDVQFAWDVSSEDPCVFTLAVIADSNGQIDEFDEENNSAVGQVSVLPDLEALQWSADVNGTTAHITIRNVGAKTSTSTVVRVVSGGEILGEVTVDAVAPGSSMDVAIPISHVVSSGRVEIIVNPDSTSSDEVAFPNNTATIIIFAPADFEPDGFVNWIDLKTLSEEWLQTVPPLTCDIAPTPNGDGIVNFLDFAEFAKYWLENYNQ
jgi:hypothetical protein